MIILATTGFAAPAIETKLVRRADAPTTFPPVLINPGKNERPMGCEDGWKDKCEKSGGVPKTLGKDCVCSYSNLAPRKPIPDDKQPSGPKRRGPAEDGDVTDPAPTDAPKPKGRKCCVPWGEWIDGELVFKGACLCTSTQKNDCRRCERKFRPTLPGTQIDVPDDSEDPSEEADSLPNAGRLARALSNGRSAASRGGAPKRNGPGQARPVTSTRANFGKIRIPFGEIWGPGRGESPTAEGCSPLFGYICEYNGGEWEIKPTEDDGYECSCIYGGDEATQTEGGPDEPGGGESLPNAGRQ